MPPFDKSKTFNTEVTENTEFTDKRCNNVLGYVLAGGGGRRVWRGKALAGVDGQKKLLWMWGLLRGVWGGGSAGGGAGRHTGAGVPMQSDVAALWGCAA